MAGKILVVDDEKPLNHALSLKLTHAGYEVDSAFDGEEGLAKLQKGSYDLVLLDMIMPKMDGFKVLEELRKIGNKTPVIVLSNLGQPEDERRTKELGASGFFIKSNIALSDIVKQIDDTLKNA